MKSKVIGEFLTTRDRTELELLGSDLYQRTGRRPDSFIATLPQIYRPADGWCSDTFSFFLSYRFFHYLYLVSGGRPPAVEFEWQFLASGSVSKWNLSKLLCYQHLVEVPESSLGAMISSTKGFTLATEQGTSLVPPGGCFFLSSDEALQNGAEILGEPQDFLLFTTLYPSVTRDDPWMFRFS